MGSQSVRAITSQRDRKEFIKHLLNDIEAFQMMIDNEHFEKNIQRIGAEQEVCLVKDDYTPSYNALEILEKVNDEHFTTELGLFNLELNLDPYELKENCFSRLEAELNKFMSNLEDKANAVESNKVVLAGILPTLRIKDLDFKYITPYKRYKTLNKVIKDIRGDEFKLHIMGVDELKLKHESILFEACNTSFQVHLQIDPNDAIDLYNWSQMIAGPVLSIMTNSPLLLGKELWSETRIALFQQSVDLRNRSHLLRGQKPRVSFGSNWVKKSIAELFIDDIARYAPLVTSDFEENSVEMLNKGIMPKMKALNLHNGTLYKWNRMCYGVHKNVAHLRIENRYIPSGPSTKDEIANALFWIGVMQGMPKSYRNIWKKVPFKEAKGNFINAARTGIESYFMWFGKEISAIQLANKVLLPMARKGLKKSNVSQEDIDHYLGIIEARIANRQTGSKWMLRNKRALSDQYSMYETNVLLTKAIHDNQQKNRPVHQWEDIYEFPKRIVGAKNKAYKIMSRELFVVHEDDSIGLVKKIMEWKEIHHVPIVDNNNKIVGVIDSEYFPEIDKSNESELTAKELKNTQFITVHPDTSLEEMKQLIKKHKITSLAVIYKDELFGLITKTDLLNAELA